MGLQRGIKLYRQGYAPMPPICVYFRQRTGGIGSVGRRCPLHAFILGRKAKNTYQDAERSKALMEQYGLKSAIVVSSDYHMRRASLIFVHVFRGTGTTFTYVSVPDPGFHPEQWWTSRQTMLQMCYQFAGIVVLYLGLGPYVTSDWIYKWPFWYLFRYMH